MKAFIFKLFNPLASFSYATWSSATFLARYSELRILRKFLLKTCITTCMIWVFHRSVYDCTFIAPPEDLYFLTLYCSSFMLICYLISCNLSCELQWTINLRKFQYADSFITLQRVRLGFFTAPSKIVPSLHRMKACIFKLLKLLASFSYATWSSATFLASCSEPWTCGNLNTLIVYTTSLRVRLGFLIAPSTIVPSLYR